MESVLADSWLARLKKERRSVRLDGMGNFTIASVMALSILYPFPERINPAKVTSGCANCHFSLLSVILRSAQRCRNSRTWFA